MSEFVYSPKLKEFATERQAEYLDAINEAGTIAGAARSLGVARATLQEAVRSVRAKAARQGYAPGHWTDGVAPGYAMGKVTVQRANGAVERTWERQSPELEAQIAAIKSAVASFIEGVGPIEVKPAAENRSGDLIPFINIGDGHLGMLAHEAESGENFDLDIAERELCAAISILIDETPACERLVVNDLGDFTHTENNKGETERGGHRLDVAKRLAFIIPVYSRSMRFIIEKALEKAQIVDVIVNQGNHSRANDFWMAELLRVAYGHTGRVNVLNNDSVFIGYRMGKTLVMTHHSDKCKPARLVDVMSTDFAADWGETEYRYIDIGHIHHGMAMTERAGATVESFNTLAPKDKWAAEGGWRSHASITVVYRSRTYGEVGRRRLPIKEVRDRIVAGLNARERQQVYRPKERRAFAV